MEAASRSREWPALHHPCPQLSDAVLSGISGLHELHYLGSSVSKAAAKQSVQHATRWADGASPSACPTLPSSFVSPSLNNSPSLSPSELLPHRCKFRAEEKGAR